MSKKSTNNENESLLFTAPTGIQSSGRDMGQFQMNLNPNILQNCHQHEGQCGLTLPLLSLSLISMMTIQVHKAGNKPHMTPGRTTHLTQGSRPPQCKRNHLAETRTGCRNVRPPCHCTEQWTAPCQPGERKRCQRLTYGTLINSLMADFLTHNLTKLQEGSKGWLIQLHEG